MNENVENESWFYGAAPLSYWKRSFVYFIRSGDFIKIGWSKAPELRVDQIRRGGHAMCPSAGLAEDPVLLAYKPGSRKDEAALHRRFYTTHDQGDWFRRSPELDELIEETRRAQMRPRRRCQHGGLCGAGLRSTGSRRQRSAETSA